MRTYARIQDGVVAELLKTDADVTSLFAPGLAWVDVSAQPEVRESWRLDGKTFAPPPELPATVSAPSVAELRARLAVIDARLAELARKGN
jgi:hypothetical protein